MLIPEGRPVVGERPVSAGTLRLEHVKCGKKRCKKCAEGEGHSPYTGISTFVAMGSTRAATSAR